MTIESIRRRAGFKKHLHQSWPGRKAEKTADLVLTAGDRVPNWVAESTRMIPEWRLDIHDVYMRWAITINAMHVARDRYASIDEIGLETKGLRTDGSGRAKLTVLDTWTSKDTARNYELSIPILSAYAVADMYGLLEEIIFELYLIFLNENPCSLLSGPEYKSLKKLHRRKDQGIDAFQEWESAWTKRLSEWHRKQGFNGLHQTFKAYYEKAKVKRPSKFTKTTIDDWAITIETIGEARNLIVHGAGEVSEKLASLSQKLTGNLFQFSSGEPLEFSLDHLMFVELFYQQLLNAIGTGLIEKCYGPLDDIAKA